MEQTATAKKIHYEFRSAQDRLLKEAIKIINQPQVEAVVRGERCRKLGFGSSKASKQAEEIVKTQAESANLIKTIEYFSTKYPFYMFITEKEISRICNKYGLILGDAHRFTGDIPEKNLKEIESFKLKEEDFVEDESDWNTFLTEALRSVRARQIINVERRQSREEIGWLGRNDIMIVDDPTYNIAIRGLDPSNPKPQQKQSKKKPAFRIAAPEKDFNTQGMKVKDNKLVPEDPIVLQPVKGGYLIVTAWGDEASDEAVVNTKMN